jgi:hypothetical protein
VQKIPSIVKRAILISILFLSSFALGWIGACFRVQAQASERIARVKSEHDREIAGIYKQVYGSNYFDSKGYSTPGFLESSESAWVPAIYQQLYRGGLPHEEVDQFRANLPYGSISLQRTPCYGTCPVYTITLYRTGKADFEATRYLPNLGKFTGEVDPFTYGRLCYLIDNSRLGEMKPSYSANWTDAPTCIVAFTEGTTRKEISDYGSVGPVELWAVQELIDTIRTRIEWKPAQ